MPKYYKFLLKDGTSPYSRCRWELPRDGVPGRWMPPQEAVLCESGYHAATLENLSRWAEDRCFEVEFRDEVVSGRGKVVGSEARLVRELAWSRDLAVSLAADYAAHVLSVFEREHPDNSIPRDLILAARSNHHVLGIEGLIREVFRMSLFASKEAGGAAYAATHAARMKTFSRGRIGPVLVDTARDAFRAKKFSILESRWQQQRLLQYLEGRPFRPTRLPKKPKEQK